MKGMEKQKTGVELIADERREQIEKHGWTIDHDIELYEDGTLLSAAIGTATDNEDWFPNTWDFEQRDKMLSKTYKERLVIAGAFIAAELDRLIALGE